MINYTESFNFKPIPSITPASDYWQNSTWKFNMPEITAGTASQPSWQDIILSGNTALTLTNAKANGLNYLKLFGSTTQNDTPTPTTPIDIVCNNGVVKVRNKSGLPLGYQAVEYLGLDGTQYIDTGIYANTTTTMFHCGLTPTQESTSGVFGSRNAKQANDGSCNIFTLNGGFRLDWTYANSTTTAVFDVNTYYDIQCSRPTCTINGVSYTSTTTASSTQTYPFYIGNFANGNEGPFTTGFIGYIHFGKLYNNGSLVFNGVPCRRKSDNVLGMYDLVSGTFFTNQGTGSFTAGQDVDDMEIYTDGTTETVEIDTTGDTATVENLFKVGTYQDVQSVIDGSVTRNVGIKVFDGSENWTESTQNIVITGATASWGAVAGVGGYCTHLTVLKSGETTFAGACRFAGDFNIYAYKTAFGVNDGTQFKQYLTDQYNAGQPVVIVYPLAEPTTETVTAQPMNIQAGTNIVEITQASIEDLELEVSFKQSTI